MTDDDVEVVEAIVNIIYSMRSEMGSSMAMDVSSKPFKFSC